MSELILGENATYAHKTGEAIECVDVTPGDQITWRDDVFGPYNKEAGALKIGERSITAEVLKVTTSDRGLVSVQFKVVCSDGFEPLSTGHIGRRHAKTIFKGSPTRLQWVEEQLRSTLKLTPLFATEAAPEQDPAYKEAIAGEAVQEALSQDTENGGVEVSISCFSNVKIDNEEPESSDGGSVDSSEAEGCDFD